MREFPVARCERNFINKCVAQRTRLDGRDLLEARSVKIHFDSNWGCCLVSLGQTKVVAKVSCDVQQPKTSRPNEGMVYINVELNPIAAQHFESGRQSEAAILINRQLEKCFKDSKCIDLESLCIVADKKVWNLRIDVNVINHDGNLLDCASIATLAALLHFHRPDVTSTGDGIVIHPFSEKDPLPLSLFHHPVCVSFIAFEEGGIVMDPTYLEERVGVLQLTLGINSYKELCSLQFDYLTKTTTVVDVISAVSNHAANYAATLIAQIRDIVSQDVQARYKKLDTPSMYCLKDCIAKDKITAMINERISIKLSECKLERKFENGDVSMDQDEETDSADVIRLGDESAELIPNQFISKLKSTQENIGEGGVNTWQVETSSSEDEGANDVQVVTEVSLKQDVIDDIEISGDSEEEVTDVVTTDDIMK